MKSEKTAGRVAMVTCALLSLSNSNLVQADVNFVRAVDVKAIGGVSAFTSKTKVLTQISGDKSRSEVSATSAAVETMVPDAVTIIRLDEGLSWQLKPSDQTYTEKSLASLATELGSLREQVGQIAGSDALPIRPEECSWSEAKIKTKETKEKERIVGKRAKRHIITMSQSCVDESSGTSCDVQWIMEPWLSKRVKNGEEVTAFYQGLADELSMDYLIPQMPGASQLMLGMFPNRWESLLDELDQLDGYPLRTTMTLKIGGKLCTTDDGTPIEDDNMWSDAADSAYGAAVDRSGSEAGSAVATAAGEAMGDGVGASIGGSAVGAATKEIVGGLTGVFKSDKKKKSKKSRSSRKKKSVSSLVTVFKIQSEITEWNKLTVPQDRFDVPADWILAE